MNKLAVQLKGTFILVITFAGMVFYESCCGKPEFGYYEATSLSIMAEKYELMNTDTLKIHVYDENRRYLSSEGGFFTKAVAWSCLPDGYMGPKFRYTDIKITSDKAVDDLHPPGANLNDLFFLLSYYNEVVPISPIPPDSVAKLVGTKGFALAMASRPSSNNELAFEIYLKNSNNRELTVKTSLIRWK